MWHIAHLDQLSNLRVLTPLFSPLDGSSHTMSANFKHAFWPIGEEILGIDRKGTVFAQNVAIRGDDDEDDDFDIIKETTEKLSILRPIIEPKLVDAMLKTIRTHCAKRLSRVFLDPQPQVVSNDPTDSKQKELPEDDELPDWLKINDRQDFRIAQPTDAPDTTAGETLWRRSTIIQRRTKRNKGNIPNKRSRKDFADTCQIGAVRKTMVAQVRHT